MSSYYTDKKLKEPPKHLLHILNKNTKHKLKVLDVGMGNGLNYGIKLSRYDNIEYYIGLEPYKKMYKYAKENNKKHNGNITIINKTFHEYETNKRFNVIIFFNSFHFMKYGIIKKAYEYLDDDGIIYIQEPRARAKGWATDVLNRKSKMFNMESWNRKKKRLKKTKKYLLKQPYIEFYKYKVGNVFVLRKRSLY